MGAGNFSLYRHVQNGSGAHPASYPVGTRVSLSLGVKQVGYETDHSPPSSAEVKNAWSYTPTPLICLHGVLLHHRDNFTFYLCLYPGILKLIGYPIGPEMLHLSVFLMFGHLRRFKRRVDFSSYIQT
jgi:hypothetical protein